ncbi:MAG: hypothetical protein M3356_00285 [Actinomycetota bacterium]|nr:hypothetical protein [Actinomycetota bacterium]
MRSLLALLVLAATLGLSSAASAAVPREVPRGFQGVMYDGASLHSPAPVKERQFDLMAASGVESVRFVFIWENMQPTRDSEFNFEQTDPIVELAATRGITVLPVMLYAPPWARAFPKRILSPPRTQAYQAYLRASIERYGPDGSFWLDRPDVPWRPIRDWQIWNEPSIRPFWDVAQSNERYGWPHGYARLLGAADQTIKANDAGARTVLGGLNGLAWDELRRLYNEGARDFFDVMAVHVYAQTPRRVLGALRLTREALDEEGDVRKPIFLTETAFPASRGRAKAIEHQRQETPTGMARRVTDLFSLLAKARRELKLGRVSWYTWASGYKHRTSNFEYAGLLASRDGLTFRAQPALRAFRSIARRLQGCAKDPRGKCR